MLRWPGRLQRLPQRTSSTTRRFRQKNEGLISCSLFPTSFRHASHWAMAGSPAAIPMDRTGRNPSHDLLGWFFPGSIHRVAISPGLGQCPGYHPLPSKDHYRPGRWLLEGYRSNPVLTLSLLSSHLLSLCTCPSTQKSETSSLHREKKNHVTNDS